jgi:hypothetical protein
MLLDGVISLAIGAVFLASGIIWLVHAGAIDLSGVLVAVFGIMFGSAGWSSCRDFSSMRRSRAVGRPDAGTQGIDSTSYELSSENQSVRALAKSKEKTVAEQAFPGEVRPEASRTLEPPVEPPPQKEPGEEAEEASPAADANEPPPEGFLASFADESKKKKPS